MVQNILDRVRNCGTAVRDPESLRPSSKERSVEPITKLVLFEPATEIEEAKEVS